MKDKPKPGVRVLHRVLGRGTVIVDWRKAYHTRGHSDLCIVKWDRSGRRDVMGVASLEAA